MKTALITGASSGIGSAIARVFAREGYELILLGRHRSRLESLQKDLPTRSQVVICDFNDSNSISETARLLNLKTQSPISALVNNAGIFLRKPFSECTQEEWKELFQVNFFGPVHLTKELLPLLKAANGASILNISSTLGSRPITETSIYSATKAAMSNWTKTSALELAPFKIRVNAIEPGIVRTPIHSFFGAEEEDLKSIHKLHPLGFMGEPEDVAELAYCLSRPENRWMTGSCVTIDGGISLGGN